MQVKETGCAMGRVVMMALGALFAGSTAFGATVYLKPLASGETRDVIDGTSWDTAFTTVADAVGNAGAGGVVYVARGVYVVPSPVALPAGVSIYGGFPGVSTSETIEDRDPRLYQSILSGDLDSDNVWMHYVPNETFTFDKTTLTEPVIKDGKINEPPEFTGDYDGYGQVHNGTDAGRCFDCAGGSGLLDGLVFTGFNTPSSPRAGVINISAIESGKTLSFRSCRFVGLKSYYGSIFVGCKTTAVSVRDCSFEYSFSSDRNSAMCGFLYPEVNDISNCLFRCISKDKAQCGGVFDGMSGSFTVKDSRIERCAWATGSSAWPKACAATIFSTENVCSLTMYDCAISNNYCGTTSANGPVLIDGPVKMFRCVVADNLGEGVAQANTLFSLIGSNYKDDTATAASNCHPFSFESCTFARNVIRARSVAAEAGGYALGILGSPKQGYDPILCNCTFKDNSAETLEEKSGVAPVLCRGVVACAPAAGKINQIGLANCTFLGAANGQYDIAQYGAYHAYVLNVVNCIFEAHGDAQPSPIYAVEPSLVKVYCCSILNKLTTQGETIFYEGHRFDKIPLVQEVVDAQTGRWALRPAAKVPGLYESCNVATNDHNTWKRSSWAFKRPGEDAQWESLTPDVLALQAPTTVDKRLIADAEGTARPSGAFARGALQTATSAAEDGKSLVLRREPYAAGTFSGEASQAVAEGGAMKPVTATSVDEAIYGFAGWYDEDGTLVSPDATLANVELQDEVTVLTAKFSASDVTITFDLGESGTFNETGTATVTRECTPGAQFPAIPAWTPDPAWHVTAFPVPSTVPNKNATYAASYVSSAVRIIYVTPDGAGERDGTSWENAYAGDSLAAAYADAGQYRGEVWMKEGLYPVSSSVTLLANVTVRGGFAGREDSAESADSVAHPTVFVGDEALAFINGETAATNSALTGLLFKDFKKTVIRVDSGLCDGFLIDCCTFTNCNSTGTSGNSPDGTINLSNSSFLLRGTSFLDCRNGIRYEASVKKTLTLCGCTFRDGVGSGGSAGGVRAVDKGVVAATNCLFVGNSCNTFTESAGAALSFYGSEAHTLVDCVFKENKTTVHGTGAVVLWGGASARLYRCRFLNNRADLTGDAGVLHSACLSYGNSSDRRGTGQCYLEDCFFRGNVVTCVGGQDNNIPSSVCTANGPVTLVNCTILDSTNDIRVVSCHGGTLAIAGDEKSKGSIALVNCIVKDTVNTTTFPDNAAAELRILGTRTMSLVNTILCSSDPDYRAVIAENPDWLVAFANSYVQGFDKQSAKLTGDAYCYDVVTEGSDGVNPKLQVSDDGVVALGVKGAGPVRGRPVWQSGTTVYFRDTTADAEKPWRNVNDLTVHLATVDGLDVSSPCIPDAFGRKRRKSNCACGPLEVPLGLTIFIR